MGDKYHRDDTIRIPRDIQEVHPLANANLRGRLLRHLRVIQGNHHHNNLSAHIRDPHHPILEDHHLRDTTILTMVAETRLLLHTTTITNNTQEAAAAEEVLLPLGADTIHKALLQALDQMEGHFLEMEEEIHKIRMATILIIEAVGPLLPLLEEECHREVGVSMETNTLQALEMQTAAVEDTAVLLGEEAVVPSTVGNTVDSTMLPATQAAAAAVMGTRLHPITAIITREEHDHLRLVTTHNLLRQEVLDNHIQEAVVTAVVIIIHPIDMVIHMLEAHLLRIIEEVHHLLNLGEVHRQDILTITDINLSSSNSTNKRVEKAW